MNLKEDTPTTPFTCGIREPNEEKGVRKRARKETEDNQLDWI